MIFTIIQLVFWVHVIHVHAKILIRVHCKVIEALNVIADQVIMANIVLKQVIFLKIRKKKSTEQRLLSNIQNFKLITSTSLFLFYQNSNAI